MPILFFKCCLLIFIYMSIWFGIALVKKDNGIADIAWGLGFVLIAFFAYQSHEMLTGRQLLVNVLVSLWGIRLAVYIFMRNKAKKGEDFRYKQWRKEWGNNWVMRSFLQVFMLQGAIMLLISLPILAVHTQIEGGNLNMLDYFGTILFFIGFYFEAVGDYQLYQFKKDPNNKGKVMNQGLWRYTRHPNYFGEAVMWWGLFVIALSAPYPMISLISPLLLSYLLVRVSGVPMLEKKYRNNPEYAEYIRTTSAFIPMPPKN